jgi:hypothetical protein
MSQLVLATKDFLVLVVMACLASLAMRAWASLLNDTFADGSSPEAKSVPQTQLFCAAKNQIVGAETVQLMGLGSASGSCSCASRCSSSSTICSKETPYLQDLQCLEQVAAMGLQLSWDSLEEEDDDVELRDIELTRETLDRRLYSLPAVEDHFYCTATFSPRTT